MATPIGYLALRRAGAEGKAEKGVRESNGSVLSQVPDEAGDEEPPAGDDEERQTGHQRELPGLPDEDVPHRQELRAGSLSRPRAGGVVRAPLRSLEHTGKVPRGGMSSPPVGGRRWS